VKIKRGTTVEQLYPNKRCRDAADKAVDALDPKRVTLADALDAFDQAYVDAGGKSPWRKM